MASPGDGGFWPLKKGKLQRQRNGFQGLTASAKVVRQLRKPMVHEKPRKPTVPSEHESFPVPSKDEPLPVPAKDKPPVTHEVSEKQEPPEPRKKRKGPALDAERVKRVRATKLALDKNTAVTRDAPSAGTAKKMPRGTTKYIFPNQGLRRVRDTIRENKYVLIMGPWGCGKSTLVQVAAHQQGVTFVRACMRDSLSAADFATTIMSLLNTHCKKRIVLVEHPELYLDAKTIQDIVKFPRRHPLIFTSSSTFSPALSFLSKRREVCVKMPDAPFARRVMLSVAEAFEVRHLFKEASSYGCDIRQFKVACKFTSHLPRTISLPTMNDRYEFARAVMSGRRITPGKVDINILLYNTKDRVNLKMLADLLGGPLPTSDVPRIIRQLYVPVGRYVKLDTPPKLMNASDKLMKQHRPPSMSPCDFFHVANVDPTRLIHAHHESKIFESANGVVAKVRKRRTAVANMIMQRCRIPRERTKNKK